jgi:hypothetical protein
VWLRRELANNPDPDAAQSGPTSGLLNGTYTDIYTFEGSIVFGTSPMTIIVVLT